VIRNPKAILALLTLLNLLNYLDRFVLFAVLAPLQEELRLSGLVSGGLPTLFLLAYFATSPIFGHLGDRGGKPTRGVLIALGIAVWSLATVATGLAHGALALCVARVLVGVGEASYATLAPTIVDDVAPPAERGKWMGIFSAATPLGSALGYVVGGAVLSAHGWRAAFFVAGAPGALAALLCLFIAEPRAREEKAEPEASRPDWFGALRALARAPLYRAVVGGYCAYTFAIGGFAAWAPKYLHLRYGLEQGPASVRFGLLTLAGGALGTLLGGALSDRAVRKRLRKAQLEGGPTGTHAVDDMTARANLAVTAVSSGLGALLCAGAIAAPTAGTFFGVGLPCLTALFVLSGPINVAILKSAPASFRANAMGIAIFAIHALGDLWSPPLIGLASDRAPMKLVMYAVPAFFAFGALVWWGSALREYQHPSG
jgi:MFS family permease